MVELLGEERTTCVDIYEAGVGSLCPVAEPRAVQDTVHNLQTSACMPQSAPGMYPWRFVSYRLAEQLCARAGKSLVTTEVWYRAALGTPDTAVACGVDTKAVSAGGSYDDCVSGSGAYDMIGNVWELVHGEVIDGALQTLQLPESGYVTGVNDAGVPTATALSPNPLYGADYFWREAAGTYAVMRGGYYKGQQDAGLYSIDVCWCCSDVLEAVV
jgi:formylglycine-generating enzyme required for sulfatase activity